VDSTGKLVLSTSAVVINSHSNVIGEELEDTIAWLDAPAQNRTDALPLNLMNFVTKVGERETRILKIAKDISILPIEDIGQAISAKGQTYSDQIIDIIVNEL